MKIKKKELDKEISRLSQKMVKNGIRIEELEAELNSVIKVIAGLLILSLVNFVLVVSLYFS